MIREAVLSPVSIYTNFRRKHYPLFWFVAAVDEDIIKECPVAEQDKQAGIGMAILCTTLAALLSGFYAIQSIVDYWLIAVPASFFYALMIFNLDRFMVGSMRKDIKGNKLKEIQTAIPRIVLATVIALLIVKPIEVKLFKNQIKAANLLFNKNKKQNLLQNDINSISDKKKDQNADLQRRDQLEEKRNCNSNPEYNSFQEIYSSCTTKVAHLYSSKQQTIANLNTIYHNSNYTTTDENGRTILNDVGIEKRNNYRVQITKLNAEIAGSNCEQYIDSMRNACSRYTVKLNRDIEDANERVKQSAIQIKKSDSVLVKKDSTAAAIYTLASGDLLGELDTLNQLKTNNSSIWWSNLFISLFFFIIEIAPLVVKILSPRGKYDTLLYITEQCAVDHEEYAIKESSHLKEIKIKSIQENESEIIEAEKRINKELFEKILREQSILTEKIVETWRKCEENAIAENPDEYIRKKIKTDNDN